MNSCVLTCVVSHLIWLQVRRSGTILSRCSHVAYGELPCCHEDGRLDLSVPTVLFKNADLY
jgi:hypothetical protein